MLKRRGVYVSKRGLSTLEREMKLGSFDADAIVTKLDRRVRTRHGVLVLTIGGECLLKLNVRVSSYHNEVWPVCNSLEVMFGSLILKWFHAPRFFR